MADTEEIKTEDKIEVPASKDTAKKKITVELEVDTHTKDVGPNPFAKTSGFT